MDTDEEKDLATQLQTYDVSNEKQHPGTAGKIDCWCRGSGCTECRPCEECQTSGRGGDGHQCLMCGGSGMRQ